MTTRIPHVEYRFECANLRWRVRHVHVREALDSPFEITRADVRAGNGGPTAFVRFESPLARRPGPARPDLERRFHVEARRDTRPPAESRQRTRARRLPAPGRGR